MTDSEQDHMWDRYHYTAFVSYSRIDKAVGDKFQRAIERYKIPKPLVERRTLYGPVPRKLIPVYRDITDSSATGDLGARIQQALAQSAFLIVLCSPHSAASRWVNVEIESFKRLGGKDRIIAILVDGEPVEYDAVHSPDGAFPPALMRTMGDDGVLTETRENDPLSPDLRPQAEGFHYAVLKTVAAMIGLAPDILGQRQAEMERRERRAIRRVAVAMMGLAALAMVSATAAVNQLVASRINQSATFAGLAWSAISEGRYDRAARLALEGLPAGDGLAITVASSDAEDAMEAALWANRTVKQISAHEKEGETITALNLSADGRTAASVGLTGWVRVWDISSGEVKLTVPWLGRWMESFIQGKFDAELSPDGSRVITFGAQRMPMPAMETAACSFSYDESDSENIWNNVLGIIWDVKSGCPIRALGEGIGNNVPMSGFSWSPDGASIAAFNWRNRHIGVFDSESGALRFEFDSDPEDPSGFDWNESSGVFSPEPIFSAAGDTFLAMTGKSEFSLISSVTGEILNAYVWPYRDEMMRRFRYVADEKSIIVSSRDGKVLSYDVKTGAYRIVLEFDDPLFLYDLDVSADAELFAALIMDEDNNRTLHVYSADHTEPLWSAPADRIAFTLDGAAIVAFTGSNGAVLDPTTGLKIAGLGGLSAPVSEMRSAGGALVITGVENGQIRIWNAATREPVAVGTGVTRLDANLAHDRVAIMQDENRVLQIRSDLGDTISTLTFEKPLKGFDIDAAASSVALLFEDGTLEVRDTATSGVITAPLEQVKMLASQGLSADGQRLAYVADDNRLVVVDVASSSPLTDVQFPKKTSLEALLSADGRSLFVSERGYQGRMAAFTVGDATPRWEYRGRVREDETAQNQPGLKLRHFFAAPDGSRILVIEDDSPNGEFSVDHAVLLDGLTGAIISVPAFSSYESITSGAFSRYGSVFVTSSYSELGDGGGVKVWDAATGVLRSILEDDAGKLSAIDFTEDAKRVAYADGDGRINLWATDSGRKIGEISSKLAGRNMRSHAERLILIGDELWVQESTGALMSFETPRQRHSPMIAKDACSMLSGAGVEAFTLEEQASFGISDKRLQPCNVKGAFSWRFYAKASHEVWQRLEQRICGLLN